MRDDRDGSMTTLRADNVFLRRGIGVGVKGGRGK